MTRARATPRGDPRRPTLSVWHAFAAGLAHAACMVAAFPPFDLWGISLLAVGPLAWIAAGTRQAGQPGPSPAPRPFRLALFAGIGTLPFHAFEHRWLWDVAGPGYPILVVLLAAFPTLYVWILARAARCLPWPMLPIAGALLWGGLEFFRGTIAFDGYPWFFVGHPLIAWTAAAAPASVVGAFGVSLLAASIGAAVGCTLARPGPRALAGSATWLLATVGLWLALSVIGTPEHAGTPQSVRVAVVQTNLPQSNKMDWTPADRIEDLLWFLELTEFAARPGPDGATPDLIVWPETMFPGLSLDDQARAAEDEAQIAWNVQYADGRRETLAPSALANALLEQQQRLGIPMLVGAIGFDNVRYAILDDGRAQRSEDAMYNSVFSLAGGRVLGRYDKLHLTPFGEVMPYISYWSWLERQLLGIAAGGMSFDLAQGAGPVVLDLPRPAPPAEAAEVPPPPGDGPGAREPARAAAITPICFESTNPEVCRRLLARAREAMPPSVPIILVNPTNDGWFGDNDAGRAQHLQLARWRAVELGIPVVRAANTGISCAIDTTGRITARGVHHPDGTLGDARADGVLLAELRAPGERTIFAAQGDLLGWFALAAAGLFTIVGFWPGRAPGHAGPASLRAAPPPGAEDSTPNGR